MKLLAPLLVVAVLGACCPTVEQLYSGAPRPDVEIATVSTETTALGIETVDGQRTQCWHSSPPREVRLLPGRHEIGVRWFVPATPVRAGYFARVALVLDAAAGHSYVVKCHRALAGAGFWIEDRTTGRIVTAASPGG